VRATSGDAVGLGVECIVQFKETPSRVFNIMTLDEYMELWLSDNGRPVHCQCEARVGGQLRIQGALCDQRRHAIKGTIVHYSYPTCLVLHCHERCDATNVQRIAVALRTLRNRTQMTVTHFGLRDIHDYRIAEMFWHMAICKIIDLLHPRCHYDPHLASRPKRLTAMHRLERPWIPHPMSFEPPIYARKS
jgi:uncharacterized protein YndB with AHSA1/START domain